MERLKISKTLLQHIWTSKSFKAFFTDEAATYF